MRSSRCRETAIIAAGTLLYLLLGWSSLRLAMTQANASAVWPLAGLGISALARCGYRYWPIVFLGTLGNNFLANWQHGAALPPATLAALGIAIGNTAEALTGTRRALGFPPTCGRSAVCFVLFSLRASSRRRSVRAAGCSVSNSPGFCPPPGLRAPR